jgi:hypothetical protein
MTCMPIRRAVDDRAGRVVPETADAISVRLKAVVLHNNDLRIARRLRLMSYKLFSVPDGRSIPETSNHQ